MKTSYPQAAIFLISGAGCANLNGYYGDFGDRILGHGTIKYCKMDTEGSKVRSKEQVYYSMETPRWVMQDDRPRYMNPAKEGSAPRSRGWVCHTSGAGVPPLPKVTYLQVKATKVRKAMKATAKVTAMKGKAAKTAKKGK